MEKAFVAKRVAAKLRITEHSIDAALAESAETIAEIIRARKELKLGANVADGAIAKVSAAVAALSAARTGLVDAHAELAEIQDRLGIRTKAYEEKLEEGVSEPVRQVA